MLVFSVPGLGAEQRYMSYCVNSFCDAFILMNLKKQEHDRLGENKSLLE